ncbi:hypothetical protein [Streptomyces rishiriensis]|uniref:Uncharacterized protein n=1 Tax=Streptomyces rishiriensis TaxID=68264 RepID=A0ABU0NRL8_STRRH|nr:hypothetical protein [Streptomyces rishiriensis]MDQ0581808.1 hypothetical protein [Streptomyces rishiriensis]
MISEPEELRRMRDEADADEARAREAAPSGLSMSYDAFVHRLGTEGPPGAVRST